MKLIYINYLSISEVADYMGVSRQAINQAKNRAIDLYLEGLQTKKAVFR